MRSRCRCRTRASGSASPWCLSGSGRRHLAASVQSFGPDSDLAAPGGYDLAGHPDVVSKVDRGPPVPQAVQAELVCCQHDLKIICPVPEGHETEFAVVPTQHHPTSDRDPRPGPGVGGESLVRGAHLAAAVGPHN